MAGEQDIEYILSGILRSYHLLLKRFCPAREIAPFYVLIGIMISKMRVQSQGNVEGNG
jgi:hypothetical protein